MLSATVKAATFPCCGQLRLTLSRQGSCPRYLMSASFLSLDRSLRRFSPRYSASWRSSMANSCSQGRSHWAAQAA
ncbi:hypothetical protein [Baaleninema sp.]|uniref:hypothetical protein n=1 Tax=Baaleninema sp. TaxID=3101197 RepID=UPI003D01322F